MSIVAIEETERNQPCTVLQKRGEVESQGTHGARQETTKRWQKTRVKPWSKEQKDADDRNEE